MKNWNVLFIFWFMSSIYCIGGEKGIQTLNDPTEIRLAGIPEGGSVSIGEWQQSAYAVSVNSIAGEPLQNLVARLVENINNSTLHLSASAKVGEPTTIVLRKAMPWYLFMTSTDSGIPIPPSVANLSSVLNKANNTCTLTWRIPLDTQYDYILVSKNQDIGSKLKGDAISCTDDLVRGAGVPTFEDMDLQYRVIGWKNGLPSNLAQIWVLQTVRIVTASLPAGQTNAAYSTPITVSGGIAPYTWSVASADTLPAGLNLNPTNGQITGKATNTGVFYFTVKVVDSGTPASSALRRLELKITP